MAVGSAYGVATVLLIVGIWLTFKTRHYPVGNGFIFPALIVLYWVDPDRDW